MTRGKAEHLDFELETHPIDQYAVQNNTGESVVFELDHLRKLEPDVLAHETHTASPMIPSTGSIQSSGPLQYTQSNSANMVSNDLQHPQFGISLNPGQTSQQFESNAQTVREGPFGAPPASTSPFNKATTPSHKESALKILLMLQTTTTNLTWNENHISLIKSWTRNLLRLTDLLKFGECREIMVFGILDKETKQLLTKPLNNQAIEPDGSNLVKSRYIILSGIIDHLVLENRVEATGIFEEYQNELTEKLNDEIDHNELIQASHELAPTWNDLLQVTLKDLKTRPYRSVPDGKTQKVHEYQVGFE
ncbi:unnamed protein product [Ambrosiozyma monospora]|uniref:Unnamed protein product n=1 Tax=Ambrosiozyma monospora TaxID=43982 RepID=A0A9W6WML1_AMBMO|nr:unnamed protein product [Ambrosiozyma monospora]